MKKRVLEIDMVNRKGDTRLGFYSLRCMDATKAKNKSDSNA